MSGMWGTWGTGGVRVKFADGKSEGEAFGYFDTGKSARRWVVVLWDDSDTPQCILAEKLKFKHIGGRTFKPERL